MSFEIIGSATVRVTCSLRPPTMSATTVFDTPASAPIARRDQPSPSRVAMCMRVG